MTAIEWTHRPGTKGETWNPVAGCSIVSPGCTNCYAMKMAARIEKMGTAPHYAGTTTASKAGAVWTGKIAAAPDRILTAPLRWKSPRTIFVNSMSDLFHEDVPDELIDRVFAVMALTPQHAYQILTKRAERMRDYFAHDDGFGRWGYIEHCARQMARIPEGKTLAYWGGKNLPNVWLGISAERQQEADERIPHLLATPAAVRFVSAEPLLGPIQFDDFCNGHKFIDALRGNWWHDVPDDHPGTISRGHEKLDWIIVGGESGPGARPMHPAWARSIRDQCAAAGTAFFFKQWGAWLPGQNDVFDGFGDGRRVAHWQDGGWGPRHVPPQLASRNYVMWDPDGAMHTGLRRSRYFEVSAWAQRVGKKAAGRTLDGREHNDWPEAAR
ncbi:phage Gp37/Gp68 family protein [Mesorhizobium xinjiangense]|uniref:phage Gp37/Gp68 family protein n=1 Tax=Mesorhizobium xinjiangense TaxID=2678685 RepID=UPI0012EE7E06|nr:phage Gp37/Gp68 family protein [Mesorhizobium xinjiangense]